MENTKNIDRKEIDFPETAFIQGIEDRVFQGIVAEVLAHVQGIYLPEGGFIDTLLGRNPKEGPFTRAISCEQDSQKQSISIKIEVSIEYGLSLPQKAEQIQSEVSNKIMELTGLHVNSVHVIFKNIVPKGLRESSPTPFFLGTPFPIKEEHKEVSIDGF